MINKIYKSVKLSIIPYLLFSNLIFTQESNFMEKIIERETIGIRHMVEGFRELATLTNNIDVLEKIPTYKSNTDNYKFDFTIIDIEENDENIFRGTIAIALGSTLDDKIHIIIDIKNWLQLSVYEKFSTIIHELCHDALNLKHTDDDPRSLMHPTSQPKTLEELTRMTVRMLENYKFGLLKEFDKNELYIHSNSIESKTKIYNRSKLNNISFRKIN
tara:strand:- start:177 stop:824 length:648 start_codon:yes stop_codon:yes gene_type:complete